MQICHGTTAWCGDAHAARKKKTLAVVASCSRHRLQETSKNHRLPAIMSQRASWDVPFGLKECVVKVGQAALVGPPGDCRGCTWETKVASFCLSVVLKQQY